MLATVALPDEPCDPGSLQSVREHLELALGIAFAETWPARYRIHKYWGRKPANVVARHVAHFSAPGALVVDPFAGSGVTLVEAARLGRRALGVDLNPFAVRLSRAMLAPPALGALERAARTVLMHLGVETGEAYVARCPHCTQPATLRAAAYEGATLREVRTVCPTCGPGARPADAHDVALAAAPHDPPSDAPDDDIVFGWEMQKLRRAGVRRWSELFTRRNFRTAALLRRAILRTEDERAREWLLLTLTASLAQCTRMIADSGREAGGPSWKINCYWLPRRSQELNPLWYFANRVQKSLQAAHDLNAMPMADASVMLGDSRQVELARASVDYVFTDPPYGGEGIQYGELSTLWALWLGERQDLSAEIAFNPYRKLDQTHYETGLCQTFDRVHHALKPGAFMTVTFANKDPVVWDALMRACRRAGFALVTAAPMKRSLPGLTETNNLTAPKADLVLSFLRPSAPLPVRAREPYCLESAVERIARALEREGRELSAADVFDRVTVDWFSWFYEGGDRPASVEPTLARVSALLGARAPLSAVT